ncbi:hypothetical protein HaLaN_00859 [Haematococcus lacustris]|uniref:Uncharacterized protein n=1 Tax=Haematococcus lacustris TaxID=44745 RepID=A0A699YEJ7_HAELA|nr:hypothetical protein HaLaN_00859 [Haematococcus lacustris]
MRNPLLPASHLRLWQRLLKCSLASKFVAWRLQCAAAPNRGCAPLGTFPCGAQLQYIADQSALLRPASLADCLLSQAKLLQAVAPNVSLTTASPAGRSAAQPGHSAPASAAKHPDAQKALVFV